MKGGWGFTCLEFACSTSGLLNLEPFRAGAGVQTPVCRPVQSGARQLSLTRCYRLRRCRLPKLRGAHSNPVSLALQDSRTPSVT